MFGVKETISACIVSIRERHPLLERTIHSLLPQVDKIYLFLNNYDEIAARQLLGISPEKIEYVLGDNSHGDAGKFYWADRLDGYILTADDDLVFPPDYVRSVIGGIRRYGRKAIVSFHGRIIKPRMASYYKDFKNYFSYSGSVEQDVFIHIAGTGCMGWHSASFKISMSEFPSANMADIHASILAQKNKIPIVVLKHKAHWIKGTHFADGNSISDKAINSDAEQTERVNKVHWKLYKVMIANKKSASGDISPAVAYIINLDRRPDRYKAVFDECEKNNIIPARIDAVDGRGGFEEIVESRLMKAHYGCAASHVRALETALCGGNEYSLIIEDDCVFADNFLDKLKSYARQLPPDWQLLYLGGSLINTPIYVGGNLISHDAAEKYSDNIYRAKNVLTTHAYIIKNNSIPKLLEVIKSEKNKIDILFCKFQASNKCFIVYPELAWQRSGHSDIAGRSTNNTHLRYGK